MTNSMKYFLVFKPIPRPGRAGTFRTRDVREVPVLLRRQEARVLYPETETKRSSDLETHRQEEIRTERVGSIVMT